MRNYLKLHQLLHFLDFSHVLGPIRMYSSELVESGNKYARHHIVNSNRQNLSHDTAFYFSRFYTVQNMLQNGNWKDKAGVWRQQGDKLPDWIKSREYEKLQPYKKKLKAAAKVSQYWVFQDAANTKLGKVTYLR